MKAMITLAVGTWRQFSRDKIFHLAFFVAVLLIAFAYLLATLTIIESRKILLDFGFAALSLSGMGIAVFLGTAAIAREMENRTIYMVVSKPVSRSAYFLGKFSGSVLVLAAAHALLTLPLLFILRASGEAMPSGFFACCGLILLENLIVLAFAFLVSIPFSSVMAAGLCIAFFLVGRSSISIKTMAEHANSEGMKFFAKILYFVFPNLERFNLRDVVAYGQAFPPQMVSIGVIYALAYSAACLCLGLLLFQARDLP